MPGYVKILEGIESTPALIKLLTKAVEEQHCDSKSKSKSKSKDGFYSMPRDEAVTVVEEFLQQRQGKGKGKGDATVAIPIAIPLNVIRAATNLLKDLTEFEFKLNQALSTKLVYTPAPPKSASTKSDDELRRFNKRMDRLRLRAEESRYKKLTDNLDTSIADDVTVKSMTYAISVGLNMIVAPISFGVFMYFFAGQIFTWISASPDKVLKPHETDIRGVIAGVISGVAMLFIEMILFVIRTHTMDKSVRKKAAKKKISPFGYTRPDAVTPLTAKTY
jgi:hypothetical protein